MTDIPRTRSTTPKRHRLAVVGSMMIAALCLPARADLQDEVQVYDNSINRPGEFGLELHVNSTPSGRGVSNYPGELPPVHATRVTPELSWGYSPTVELGLYAPTLRRPDGQYDLAGGKVRLKWLPVQPGEDGGGFAGVNFELSRLAYRYSESRTSLETRFIAGWRNDLWLLAVNPTLGVGLSGALRGRRPDLNVGVKVSRTVASGIAAGLEAYSGSGPLGRPVPLQQQDHRVFLALDVDRQPWVFNAGVGYGLTHGSDRWTFKTIFEIPLAK